MDSELIEILKTNKLNSKEKYDIFSERLNKFCNDPEKIIGCYRILKGIEFELQLIQKQKKTNIDEYTVEKLLHQLSTELEIIRWKIKHPGLANVSQKKEKNLPTFCWTGEKIELVEIIYAIKMSVNKGQVSIHALKACFEYVFQIDLSNIYDLIKRISRRKKVKTKYLEKLTLNFENIIEKFDT